MSTELPKPRIIVEIMPDNSIEIEQYINGARKRQTVPEGMLAFCVRDALVEQRNYINATAERKEALRAKAEADLHRKVWRNVAYGRDGSRGQGEAFADKFVGRIANMHRQAHDTDDQADLIRACHCGRVPHRGMEKCADCPGISGGGKILKGTVARKRNTQALELVSPPGASAVTIDDLI